jgi:hypothetical protein
LADPKIVDSNSASNPQLDGTRHKDPHLERVIALTVNIVHYMFWILFGVELYGVDGFKRWLDVNLRQRAREEVMTPPNPKIKKSLKRTNGYLVNNVLSGRELCPVLLLPATQQFPIPCRQLRTSYLVRAL